MSERHRQHVMRHTDANDTTPPANPARAIRNSTRDVLDEPAAKNAETRNQLVDGITHAERRRAQSNRGKNAGAFDHLRKQVRQHCQTNGGPGADESGFDVNEQIARVKAMPKPAVPGAFTKAIKPSFEALARKIGGDAPKKILKSLAAGYGTDSATLTGGSAMRKQSLDKKIQATVAGGDAPMKPKKLLTKAEIQRASAHALMKGDMSPEECLRAQSAMDLDRPIDQDIMSKIEAAYADVNGRPAQTVEQLSKSMRVDSGVAMRLASHALAVGKITGAEAQQVEACLQSTGSLPAGVVAHLRAAAK